MQNCVNRLFFGPKKPFDANPLWRVAENKKLGSAKNETLAKLIQHFSENRLYQVLSSHGPSWFLNLFYDAGEESLFQRNYVNLCHLCHEIFSNPKAISLIQKNLVEETKLP